MPYGRLGQGSGGSSGTGDAIEGAVIGQVPALQLAKTNLIVASGDFTNAAWVNNGLAITANSTVAPNGATQADTLDDNSAVALEDISQTVAIANDANPYTFSCYFTLGTSTQSRIQIDLTGGVTPVSASVDFNPANGAQIAAAGTGTADISSVLIDGVTWIRVAITADNNASGNVNAVGTIFPASLAAASVGTVIAWGAQLEQNDGPTDLIQTDITPVFRRAGSIPPYLMDHSYLPRQVTTNYAIDPVIDNGRLLLVSSSATLTLPALSQAGTGWGFTFKNTATGVVTIQGTTNTELLRVPGGAQAGTIGMTFPYSATTGAGPYNVCGGVICAGDVSIWEMLDTIEAHGVMLMTTNGTFTVPAGVITGWIDGVAGGGGGGGATGAGAVSAAGGAAGGVCAIGQLVSLVPGQAHTVVIGAGGLGGTITGGADGANGSSSNFGALLTLPGGTGGSGSATGGVARASAGTGSGQGGGRMSPTATANFGGAGGGTIYGPPTPTNQAAGGSLPGIQFGGGGAGAVSPGAGGTGAPGFIKITW